MSADPASPWIDAQLLRTDPLLVRLRWSQMDNLLGPALDVGPMVHDRPATFLIWNPWYLDDWFANEIASQVTAYRRSVGDHRFIFLCNDSREVTRLTDCGLEAWHLGHNLFVNEEVFRIEHDTEQCFDAVYNAQMTEYKRHDLCRLLPSLLLITYFFNPDGTEVFDRTRKALPQAAWANFPSLQADDDSATLVSTGYRSLAPDEVCHQLNRACTGLCLSQTEGQMYASLEYLLCGLPVVTTPSVGGRDRYFDADHTIEVDPDPGAVLRGVRTMIGRRLDPAEVRAAALVRMVEDRERLGSLLDELCSKGGGEPWSPEEQHRFVHRHGVFDRLDALISAIDDGQARARSGDPGTSSPID